MFFLVWWPWGGFNVTKFQVVKFPADHLWSCHLPKWFLINLNPPIGKGIGNVPQGVSNGELIFNEFAVKGLNTLRSVAAGRLEIHGPACIGVHWKHHCALAQCHALSQPNWSKTQRPEQQLHTYSTFWDCPCTRTRDCSMWNKQASI